MHHIRRLGALLLLGLWVGCTGRGDSDTLQTRTPPPVDQEQVGDQFEPARYWVLKQVFTTLVVLPVIGTTQMSAQSENYYVLSVSVDGTTLTQEETYCWSTFAEVGGMVTWLPDAFYEATGQTQRTAFLDEAVVGAHYEAPDVLTLYGAELSDPRTEALPTEPDDPRVVDFDGDGNPGFTAMVDGWLGYAESYLAQRTVTTMYGTVVREDRIEGSISSSLEQVILDASKWWAGLEGFESVPSGKPEENFFILQAVDAPMSCQQLEQVKDTIFQ